MTHGRLLQAEEAADREFARRQQEAERAIDQQMHLVRTGHALIHIDILETNTHWNQAPSSVASHFYARLFQAWDCWLLQLEARKGGEEHRTGQLLQRQAAEKAARDVALHKLYDDNPPSLEYFGQFQTSHR